MKAPVLVFVALCIAVGLAPMTVAGPLVASVATVVLGAPAPAFELALWHGLNLPLALSAVALGGGAWLYLSLRRGGALHRYQPREWSGKASFTALNDGLFGAAGRITSALENGSLQRYAACMVVSVIVLAAWPFLGAAGAVPQTGTRALLPASALSVTVWVLLLVTAAAVVVLHRQRFTATVLLGAVGLVASLTFVALSAPDLAMTQLSVDVVSTALLLMGLALLPQVSPAESGMGRRGRDALLALAGGGGIAWLTWLMLTSDHDSISWYFLQQSVPAGGGTNAVNVILVDFRGYDTFGEITVLGIAAVGVLALLDGMRIRRPDRDPEGRPWSFAREPLMLRVGARLVLPMALVATVYIFWRGHGLPGGGFIAGLVTAVALVLQYMAVGQSRAEAVLHAGGGRRFTRWIGVGLAIAGATGAGAFLFGRPFLTSAHGHPVLPLLGEVPLATAALFDLGVYVTVVGATMLMLSVLGAASKEPSRGPSRAGGPGAALASKGSR
jgi:multicomponent K+:H+ antiporter subunit A